MLNKMICRFLLYQVDHGADLDHVYRCAFIMAGFSVHPVRWQPTFDSFLRKKYSCPEHQRAILRTAICAVSLGVSDPHKGAGQ